MIEPINLLDLPLAWQIFLHDYVHPQIQPRPARGEVFDRIADELTDRDG